MEPLFELIRHQQSREALFHVNIALKKRTDEINTFHLTMVSNKSFNSRQSFHFIILDHSALVTLRLLLPLRSKT